MVRRWSYISSTCPVKVNPKFLGVYFRKSFKSTVRFKRFSKTYSKISRKKYNLRKLSNSNFNLLMYSYSWIKYYKKNIVRNSLRQLESLYLSRIVSLGSHLQGKSNAIIESKRTNSKLVSLKLTSSLSNNFIFFHQNTIFALLSTKFNTGVMCQMA